MKQSQALKTPEGGDAPSGVSFFPFWDGVKTSGGSCRGQMKIGDYRNPEDALEPVVEAVQEALKRDLFIEEVDKEKTSGAPEVVISFTEPRVSIYVYVTVESDGSVSFTVGWTPTGKDVGGDQEMRNVPGDEELAESLRWVTKTLGPCFDVVLCRGCGRELEIEGDDYCRSCDGALREDAHEARMEQLREEGGTN